MFWACLQGEGKIISFGWPGNALLFSGELEGVAREREVLRLLPPVTQPQIIGRGWMDGWMFLVKCSGVFATIHLRSATVHPLTLMFKCVFIESLTARFHTVT